MDTKLFNHHHHQHYFYHHSLLASSSFPHSLKTLHFFHYQQQQQKDCRLKLQNPYVFVYEKRRRSTGPFAGRKDIDQLTIQDQQNDDGDDKDGEETPPTPEDLQYVEDVKTVLDLLKKNRDMLFSEVKLTVMIEDPREVERRRLLGIEDSDAPTRDDFAEALEQINNGKVPKNRVALQLLAEEMTNWPNLEVEVQKKKPGKSLYAKATDTGINPKEAAKRLNIDWDSAAEIEDADVSDKQEVPSTVGYGALYLVTAFPVIIGISVVLILFYNSLQ